MTTVLLTGGGGAGTEALWRLLGGRYQLHFADADPCAIDPLIPADRRHRLPWAADPGFVQGTVDLCNRLGADVLIPGVDEELLRLARHREAFAVTRLLLPETEYVRTMTDKLSMARTLAAKGLRVPVTCTLADECDGLAFPCIAKPRTGRGSRDVRLVRSRAEARALADAAGDAASQTVLQQRLEGVEYSVQMIADPQGCLRGIVPVRIAVKRGITLRGTTDAEPGIIDACRRIHDAARAGGCYNIQMMLTADGAAIPFEINPRVSTTMCLAVAAGIDPIAVFLERAEPGGLLPFTAGIELRRHWVNHISAPSASGAPDHV